VAGSPWFRLDLNERELRDLLTDPSGPVARDLLVDVGEIVTAGAKRRARVRTGRMRSEIHYEVGRDDRGLYVDIVSPARNRADGFPYPVVIESKRRKKRSLRPALRDIRKGLKTQ